MDEASLRLHLRPLGDLTKPERLCMVCECLCQTFIHKTKGLCNEVGNVIQLRWCLPAVTNAPSQRKAWLGNTLSEEINSSVHNDILDESDIQAVTSLSASLWSRLHPPTAVTAAQ